MRILLGLIGCNMIWAANPVMGKWLMQDFGPQKTAWLRYFSAFLGFLLFSPWIMKRSTDIALPDSVGRFLARRFSGLRAFTHREWGTLFWLGFFTFCFSPLLQMAGLDASRAVDNVLIVAMEPLITILLACLFVGARITGGYLASLVVALFGFCMLTGLTPGRLSETWRDRHVWGNLLILVSLIGEGAYSTLATPLIRRHRPTLVFGASLAIGLTLLTGMTATFWELPSWHDLGRLLSWKNAGALLWLGPIGTGFTYLYWVRALLKVSIPTMALTLFVQPLLGALFGHLLLHEKLSSSQLLGGAFILLAVAVTFRIENRASPAWETRNNAPG